MTKHPADVTKQISRRKGIIGWVQFFKKDGKNFYRQAGREDRKYNMAVKYQDSAPV